MVSYVGEHELLNANGKRIQRLELSQCRYEYSDMAPGN